MNQKLDKIRSINLKKIIVWLKRVVWEMLWFILYRSDYFVLFWMKQSNQHNRVARPILGIFM